MNLKELESFDIRKTYLTKSELKVWNEQNSLYRTLWFDKEVGGPDIEFCRFSVDLFKLYKFYSRWDKTVRINGGYILKTPNAFDITADIMNGWWYPLKIFIRCGEEGYIETGSRKDVIGKLVEEVSEVKNKKNDELIEWLRKKYNRDYKTCEALLNFLDIIYTIGNISPAGASIGGRGDDFWDRKLKILKDNWFDKSYKDKDQIYNSSLVKKPNSRSYIEKWALFLVKCENLTEPNNIEYTWKRFISDNYYQAYVNEETMSGTLPTACNIIPLSKITTQSNDKELYEKLKAVIKQIKGRGESIVKDNGNSFEYQWDIIPFATVIGPKEHQ